MKILIVNKSFELGGIGTSMVNLANTLIGQNEVDLFVYTPTGPLKEHLDPRINIIRSGWRTNVLGISMKKALQSRDLKVIAFKLFGSVWARIFDNRLPLKLAFKHETIPGEYDVAIAYHHERKKSSLTSGFAGFVLEKVKAAKKVSWIHYDPGTLDLSHKYNRRFYAQMDSVVCVSKSVMENARRAFPDIADKFDYCYNCLDYPTIRQKILEPVDFDFAPDCFYCFSACRLAKEKALSRGIACLAPILRRYPDVVWIIAGSGPEHDDLINDIRENGMEDQILLIGYQANPYHYMYRSDLIMNVSYHEAAPMVFLESAFLGKAVFATRTSSAQEFAEDQPDFYVCDNTAEAITAKFEDIMQERQAVKSRGRRAELPAVIRNEQLERVLNRPLINTNAE